jgi:hypothetical protein
MERPHSTQICFQLYRFQVIAELAESEYRRAALAAVRAALTSEQALDLAASDEERTTNGGHSSRQ